MIEIFYSGALGFQVCLFYSIKFKKLNMVQLILCFSEGPVHLSINALGTGLSQINVVVQCLPAHSAALLTSSCTDVLVQVLREVLSGGGTVLVVAHNLKAVETADQIIFIENGEVMEEGTHPELMAKRGRYHQYYQNCNILQSRTAI